MRACASLRLAVAAAVAAIGLLPALAIAAGPPFPDPVDNQAVYDTAGVLTAETIARVEAAIDKVEADTGAEVVVYTQLVPDGISESKAEADAIALMDQWGVGRAGVNDGLVILFDLKQSDPCHGQVQLYAGKGYRETWLSNEDRQRIFENDMLPKLRECDLNGALLAAMDKVSGVPGWRVLNAVLGLVLAPLLPPAARRWRAAPVVPRGQGPRLPRRPVDPGARAAAGPDAGRRRRRPRRWGQPPVAHGRQPGSRRARICGVQGGAHPVPSAASRISASSRARRPPGTRRSRRGCCARATGRWTRPRSTCGGSWGRWPARPRTSSRTGSRSSARTSASSTSASRQHLVSEGWYRERPSVISGRWGCRGTLILIAGIVTVFVGFNLPSSGFVLLGIAAIVSAIALWIISAAMPARTQAGSVIRAMLEAYRRTLEKTMTLARSMGQVVAEFRHPADRDPRRRRGLGRGPGAPGRGGTGAGPVLRGCPGRRQGLLHAGVVPGGRQRAVVAAAEAAAGRRA